MLLRAKPPSAPFALSLAAVFLVAAAVTVAFVGGCDSGSDAASAGGQTAKNDTAPSPNLPPPPPLLDGWTSPAAVIMLSGEQYGYLEPCGCSETQSGGFGRRHDLYLKMKQKGWPVTAFDLGGAVKRNREQSKYKFETMLDALREMNYEAVALGAEELRFGVDYLLSKREFAPNDDESLLSFVGSNVTLFDSPDLGPRRWKLVQVGDVKVGVTAALGRAVRDNLLPRGARGEIAIEDAAAALRPVVDEMTVQQVDLMILLSHAELQESRELARQFPEFDLVASTGGPEDPAGEPEKIESTMLVHVGQKGKYAGVVGFFPDNQDEPLRFELVDLDSRRFHNTEAMNEFMRYYQDRLREFAEIIMADIPASVHPRGWTFVGAAKCGECHKKAYHKWKTDTKHAHAYESLIEGRQGQEDNWVPRNHDPECLCCHVTGWDPQEVLRYDSGFKMQALVGSDPRLYESLKGQQCENCHGPGSRHVELEEQWVADREQIDHEVVVSARAEMKLTRELAEQKLCHRCHDLDNSPKFKFDEYWEEVKHPWRD